MKIYSGYPGGITKITNGKDFYQTEDLSNVITVYVNKADVTGITYFLSLEFLRADGRKTTISTRDAFAAGDDTTYTEDGVTYDIHNFTLTETQLAVAGTLAFTCYITIFNNSNVVVSRGALFNAVSNVRKTVTYSANTIFVVSEDDEDVPIIVADMKTAIETLAGQLASKVNKADVADNLTTNDSDKVLSAKQGKVLKDTLDGVQEELGSIQALENLDNIVGTYSELEALITIGEATEYQLNAKVQVLNDSTHDNNSTLYNLDSLDIVDGLVQNYTWRFVGYYDGYNKEQIDEIINDFEQSVTDNVNELSEQLEVALTEQTETIEQLGQLQPKGVDTENNILGKLTADGIWIGSDTGHWYYWNGTQYVDGGEYLSTGDVISHDGNQLVDKNGNNIYPALDESQIKFFNLNSDFDNLKELINGNANKTYELGAIGSSGNFVSSTNRLRIKQPIYLKANDIVTCYSDVLVNVVGYSDAGQLLVSESGYGTRHIITTNAYYYLVIKKADNTDISSSEIVSLPKNVYAVYSQKHLLNDKSLNNTLSDLSFAVGFINASGNFVNTNLQYNQIASDNYVPVFASTDKPIKLLTTNEDEFLIKVTFYDKRGNYINDTGWVGEYTLSNNCLIKITIRTTFNILYNSPSGYRNYSLDEVKNSLIVIKYHNLKKLPKECNKNYIHISFDDFYSAFDDITTNKDTYTSIYDNSFFALLKEYHDTYGAVFSCYCYLENSTYDIANVTDKFKNDFLANNDWLKFGLHARNGNMNYAEETAVNATTDYNKFSTNIFRICGSYKSIDVIPRLHNFAGNKQSLVAMRDCVCGIKGVLGADDTRQNYYLSEDNGAYLFNHERFFDAETQLHFVTTDIRFERDDTQSIVDSIASGELTWANKNSPLIVFTHEWNYSSNLGELRDVLRFGVLNNYDFDFPQNREI